MDWIDIKHLPATGEFYFLVDGEIKRGHVGDFPTATKFATLETIY
jgi:hypothetical protein